MSEEAVFCWGVSDRPEDNTLPETVFSNLSLSRQTLTRQVQGVTGTLELNSLGTDESCDVQDTAAADRIRTRQKLLRVPEKVSVDQNQKQIHYQEGFYTNEESVLMNKVLKTEDNKQTVTII